MSVDGSTRAAPEMPDRLVIAGWTLDEDRHCLERDGETVRLEPKTTQLLAFLAKHPARPQRREDLIKAIWPGVIVGDEALTTAVNKIRRALGDDRHAPRIIETIPKTGYRLVAHVTRTSPKAPPSCAAQAKTGVRSWAVPAAAALLMILVAAVLLVLPRSPERAAPPAMPVAAPDSAADPVPYILVLPFRNVGEDPKDEYFTDGMTEDVITDLSKLSKLRVIASHTALSFKDAATSALEAGRSLGVDFLLDGSMRKAGDQLRVNVQLIDVGKGYPMWAERYDRPLENVFAIQDEITGHIIEELSLRLTTQEHEALKRIAEVDFRAYDIFLQGQRSFHLLTPEGLEAAIAAYREAIQLDPTFGRAYGALSVALVRQYLRGWSETPAEAVDRGVELARKAVAMDDFVPQTHWALGYALLFKKRYEEATAAVERAIAISPSYADGYGLLALINNNRGRPEDAAAQIEKAMELNPYYTFDYPYNLGRAYYLMGRHAEAVEQLTRALQKNQAAVPPRLFLIASLVKQDLLDDAEWEVEQLMVQSPSTTLSQWRAATPLKDDLIEPFFDVLRTAGLSE